MTCFRNLSYFAAVGTRSGMLIVIVLRTARSTSLVRQSLRSKNWGGSFHPSDLRYQGTLSEFARRTTASSSDLPFAHGS